MPKEAYGENLEENLQNLLKRMKRFSYSPQPVRREYIPKLKGKKRLLGIPSYEDKLVQGVMANMLNEVYGPRFLDCSYGFIMAEYREEAKVVYGALKERLVKFGLELAEDKTRILPFGRNSKAKATFYFLGFLHINEKTRDGQYMVGHLVSRKKKKLFKANLKKWVKDRFKVDYWQAGQEAEGDKQLLKRERSNPGSQKAISPYF